MFTYANQFAPGDPQPGFAARTAHNFLVHTAVELGVLGVVSYIGLLTALGASLLTLLRSAKRGADATRPWFVLVLVGLSGTLAGRVVEQLVGSAQTSDLSLSWLLVGVTIALWSMERGWWTQPERPPARSKDGIFVFRAAVAGLVAVVAMWVWIGVVLPPVRASAVAADGASLLRHGEINAGIEKYQQAQRIEPSYSRTHIAFAELLLDARFRVQDPVQQLAAATAGYQQIELLLERNPLDLRAWELGRVLTREMALLDEAHEPLAIRVAETTVALRPGSSHALIGLAWSYFVLGEFDRALSAIRDAKLADGGEASSLAYFVEAKALQAQGRVAEALAAVDAALAIERTEEAEALRLELQSS